MNLRDIEIMNFHHLDIPRKSVDGEWVVLARNDMFLVLTTAAELVYGPGHKPKEYHFSNEMEAHFAAARYYNDSRGKTYPYIDRLLELTTLTVDDEIQSTPMDFK